MRWLAVLGWIALCALSSPLWAVGFALAWIHFAVVRGLGAVVKYGFWLPTGWVWRRLVAAYRAAATPPAESREAHNAAFLARARRGRRRGVR
jgi:hypothetical protein